MHSSTEGLVGWYTEETKQHHRAEGEAFPEPCPGDFAHLPRGEYQSKNVWLNLEDVSKAGLCGMLINPDPGEGFRLSKTPRSAMISSGIRLYKSWWAGRSGHIHRWMDAVQTRTAIRCIHHEEKAHWALSR